MQISPALSFSFENTSVRWHGDLDLTAKIFLLMNDTEMHTLYAFARSHRICVDCAVYRKSQEITLHLFLIILKTLN